MSTRCSIAWQDHTADSPGFHLFEDAFETLADADQAPVYLRLDGVQIHELETVDGGASITMQIPRQMARKMGLLPNTDPQP